MVVGFKVHDDKRPTEFDGHYVRYVLLNNAKTLRCKGAKQGTFTIILASFLSY